MLYICIATSLPSCTVSVVLAATGCSLFLNSGLTCATLAVTYSALSLRISDDFYTYRWFTRAWNLAVVYPSVCRTLSTTYVTYGCSSTLGIFSLHDYAVVVSLGSLDGTSSSTTASLVVIPSSVALPLTPYRIASTDRTLPPPLNQSTLRSKITDQLHK